ncbi:DUF1534 domain-containing protein [Pseudomonas sp. ADAK2]|nr:DUF1534 domain-containing protein [Pseudomonas sp. ADAK7]QJI51905.1 DUF1534 domain-containing protein [Pseudomonas sp. ADAK2]
MIVPTLLRGNASRDAPRHRSNGGRGASLTALPRRAWDRSCDSKLRTTLLPNAPAWRKTTLK